MSNTPTSEGPPLLDIIIPTYNNSSVAIRCLRALEQAVPGRHRLVVVDDGSNAEHRQRVADALAGVDRRVQLLAHEHNKGFKEAILTAMRFSDARYVLLLNDDTVPIPDFDLKLLEVMQADERTRAVGPVSNHPSELFQFRPEFRSIADAHDTPSQVMTRFRERQIQHGTAEVPFLTGFCLLLDREVFERVGYFNHDYEHGYFEDLEVCCRIRQLGYRLLVNEDCFVYHVGHETYKLKAREESHRIIMRNFKIYETNWSHLPEHQDLLQKMEYAGKEHPL
jgi:GT2 family glycosyltransferase